MGKSSKDKRDAYYRLAKEQGWRARSAYKLLQLDEEFDLFRDASRVVDLCAAPGSWSQVLSRLLIRGEPLGRSAWEDKHSDINARVFLPSTTHSPNHDARTRPNQPRNDVRIVAIDLQPIAPLEGITTLKADITHPDTIPLLLHALDPDSHDASAPSSTSAATHRVDVVLSDGAPDVTGLHDLDIYIQSQLLFAALNLALCVLKPGGKFVAKIFRGRDVDLLYAQLKVVFETVRVAKPRSSRASSVEAFVVCEGFCPPEGFEASLMDPLGGMVPREEDMEGVEERERQNRWIAPFLACGDLSAFDADATYHLPKERTTLDPVQPPTAPPYKRALEMRKMAGGAYGKTGAVG